MSKIKVLEIIGNACRGGLESYVLTYSKNLGDNFEVSYLFYDDSESIPFDEIEKLNGHVFTVPSIKHIFKFKKAVIELLNKEKFDIVHSHINTLSVFPLKYAKKCGVKVRIAQSHATSNFHELIRHFIKLVLRLFSRKYATHYAAVSKEAGIYQFGKKHIKDVVIMPGLVDANRFKYNVNARTKIREELGFKNNGYIAGLFGRICTTKNQEFALKLASKLPNINFLFIGSGNKDKLNKIIFKNELKNVVMLESKQNIEEYYSAIDCFILPSLYEGFGLVAIEALANGLPCVASNFVPLQGFKLDNIEFIPLDIDMWVKSLQKQPKRIANNETIKLFDSNSPTFDGFKSFYLSLIE